MRSILKNLRNINKLTKIIIILTIFTSFCLGQELNSKTSTNEHNNTYYTAGAILVGTGMLFLVDNAIRNGIKMNNNTLLEFGHSYGEFYYSLGLSGSLYLTQFIFDEKKIAATGKALFESLIVGGLTSISIKYIFGRSRPYKEKGVTNFNWFETENINNSLPSGHVITAFTTSTILSKSINNIYASIVLYGLAGLTVYQRISTDNHWLSDAFLGASIGILVGEYFGNKINSKTSQNYNLIPFYSRNNYGVSFQLNL